MTSMRVALGLVIVAVLIGAGFAVRSVALTAGVTGQAPLVPLTTVERGRLDLASRLSGDLRPSRQSTLTVPSVGGTLRVLFLVETGTAVRAGDRVAEFDPADQEYALEQAESLQREAEQEIIKRRADIEAQRAADQVTLLTAEFDVRRAELDAQVYEDLIGANEFRIRQVTLREARRRLEQVKQDARASSVTTEASIQVLEEKLTRQKLAADEARRNMQNLVLTAPIDGIVAVQGNRDAAGGIMFSGMALPEFTVGDDARSGRPILNVLDVSTMEILAKVNEQERANVAVGHRATVRSDIAPGAEYDAVVTAVAGLAGRQDYSQGPLRVFDVTLEIATPDDRLRPGGSVSVVVHGEPVEDALRLPRQAIYERDGKPVVYVPVEGRRDVFAPRPVTILHRSELWVALDGVEEGTVVALVDPASVRAQVEEPDPASSAPAGGR